MGDLIPKEVIAEKRRIKKYGDSGKRLRAMNFNEDYNPFEREVDELFYGQVEEEEDHWLGEKNLTEVIK